MRSASPRFERPIKQGAGPAVSARANFRERRSIERARGVETSRVHSWIFRNRARLRAIYGLPAAHPVPRSGPARGRARQRAGRVVRRARYVLIHPMAGVRERD